MDYDDEDDDDDNDDLVLALELVSELVMEHDKWSILRRVGWWLVMDHD